MRRIVSMIPNTITSLNLLCGCIAIFHAFAGDLTVAFWLVIVAAIFDFLDGFAARILKAYSEIGKQLDSLADMVSFGVAPAAVVYAMGAGHIAFFIAVFSALRLAKFNVDTRQSTEFIGLPTPANSLFFVSIGYVVMNDPSCGMAAIYCNLAFLYSAVAVFSILMISEIRMFSLKFKSYKLKDNLLVYGFLTISLIALICFNIAAIPFIICLYVVLSISRNAYEAAKRRQKLIDMQEKEQEDQK